MKNPLTSKTELLNLLALVIAVVQAMQGTVWLKPELQIMILAVLNAVLRFYTSEPITLGAARRLSKKQLKKLTR